MLTPWLFEDWELTLHSLGSRLAPLEHRGDQALSGLFRLLGALLGNWLLWLTAGQFQSVPSALGKLNVCLLVRMLAALDQGHGSPTCPQLV